IGFERELKNKDSGLKTSAFVCIGATLFTYLGIQTQETGRVVAQIISGVGFIGGGIIIFDRTKLKGLNSATLIWICAAIGALCGLKLYWESFFATSMILIIEVFENGFKRIIEKFRK